jgi:hypothetical protein
MGKEIPMRKKIGQSTSPEIEEPSFSDDAEEDLRFDMPKFSNEFNYTILEEVSGEVKRLNNTFTVTRSAVCTDDTKLSYSFFMHPRAKRKAKASLGSSGFSCTLD